MENIFDKETWSQFLRGRTIYDCAIVRENGFGFVLVEENPEPGIFAVTTFYQYGDRLTNRKAICGIFSTRFSIRDHSGKLESARVRSSRYGEQSIQRNSIA